MQYSFVNMSDGSGECSMKIEPVTKDDQGLYEVEVNYNIALKKQIRLYMTGNLFFSTFEQSERFKQILDKYEREYEYKSIIKPIYRGFINENEKKLYFSDHEIFNRFHKFKLNKRFSKSKRIKISELNKLEPGDYITHIDPPPDMVSPISSEGEKFW